MIETPIARLQYLCTIIPPLLNGIDEKAFSDKPTTGGWSKKEIIGHLIDSATNNHHRFVRGQFEQTPTITYHPDQWNAANHYQQMDSSQLIQFWTAYNKHILELIRHIPEQTLNNTVNTGGENTFSIHFLIADYVEHLEHHLRQVVNY